MPAADDVAILLVDDSAPNLQLYAAILARTDYRCVLANSGPQALKALLQHEFAMVLLDVRMPGMDGFETAERIRGNQRFEHLPIVFISGAANSQADFKKGMRLGAVDYLLKPIKPELLRAKVGLLAELWLQGRQLRKEKERLFLIVSNHPDPMVIVNPQGIVRYANHSALSSYGKESHDIVGTILGVPSGEDLYDLGVLREDGTQLWLQVKRSKIEWQEEEVYLLAFRDITQLKETTDQLRETAKLAAAANEAKSQFLANVSHELRSPLNSLLILAHTLRSNEEGNLTEEQVGFAGIIYKAGTDLLSAINELLDSAKIEAGKMDVSPESFHLKSLIQQLKDEFKCQAEAKSLTFYMAPAADLPEFIHADRKKLCMVLRNLLANAVKFCGQGEVRFEILKQDSDSGPDALPAPIKETLAFVVSDTGIGIAKDKQKAVFEKFVQEDGQTRKNYGGTGLGLAMVKELSVLLGGEIELVSKKGQGSTFTLYLPVEVGSAQDMLLPAAEKINQPGCGESNRRQQAAERRNGDRRKKIRGRRIHDYLAEEPGSLMISASVAAESLPQGRNRIEAIRPDEFLWLKGEKVLLISNDMRQVYNLKNTGNRLDLQILFCADLGEGVAELEHHPDLICVLMDVAPPIETYHDTILSIRGKQCFAALPVFALTPAAQSEAKEKYLELGFNGVFVKPLDVYAVLTAIRAIATR